MRYWFDSELGDIFGVTERPSADNADTLYDQISAKLAEDAFRPRALLARFGIEVMATTDDPADDLTAHEAIAKDATFPTRVIPTFRPDRYLELGAAGLGGAVKGLGAAANTDVGQYTGYIDALWRTVAGSSSPAAPRRPTTATSTRSPNRWSRRTAQRIYRLALNRSRPPRRRPPRSAGTWCWRWPGCPATTDW